MSWRESCVLPYHYSSGIGGSSYYRSSAPPSYYVPVYARPTSSDDTTAKQLMECVYTTKTNFRPLPGYEHSSQGYDRVSLGMDCDEVYPNLFVGDAGCARNKAYLKHIGITHVVNTAEGHRFGMVNTDAHFYRDTGIRYLGFPLLDHPSANIREYFHQAADFIDDAIKSGGKVLVHCLMGMSRSSTIALAYLMMKVGIPAPMALRMCRQNRDIRPNDGFLRQLAELDNKLKRDKERLSRSPHTGLGLSSRSYRL